jgi:pilus assembly protein Flp/PilA
MIQSCNYEVAPEMRNQLLRFLQEEDAVTAAEYAVLLGLILVAVIIAIDAVGSTSSGIWNSDANNITSAISASGS